MSDTILRKAHMGAIREITSLKKQMWRLETGLIVAQGLNEYLCARLHLHGKPYKMDRSILSLSEAAMKAEDPNDMDMAVNALRAMLEKIQGFMKEAMAEMAIDPKFTANDDVEADRIVREVLALADRKLEAYRDSLTTELGLTENDIREMADEIRRRYGLDKDSQ
jgi:hypothetical protein